MKVNFNFDYALNVHNRNIYINSIKIDDIDEEEALEKSLVKVNRSDIKTINKTFNGCAVIVTKGEIPSIITTIEEYEEIIDIMEKARLALDIMKKEKVYIFDDFEVDDDELNVCEVWKGMKNK